MRFVRFSVVFGAFQGASGDRGLGLEGLWKVVLGQVGEKSKIFEIF